MVEKIVTEINSPISGQKAGIIMAVSKAQQKAVNKYVKEKYDRINVNMPKGKKAIIQDHVAATGKSLNTFINEAIDEKMEREADLLK